jgi:hypothetical protein
VKVLAGGFHHLGRLCFFVECDCPVARESHSRLISICATFQHFFKDSAERFRVVFVLIVCDALSEIGVRSERHGTSLA